MPSVATMPTKRASRRSVCFRSDVTKLPLHTPRTGIEVWPSYEMNKDIQIEFGDNGNILAYISIGDRIQDIERLVGALADIKRLYWEMGKTYCWRIYPTWSCFPPGSLHSEREEANLDESVGQVWGILSLPLQVFLPLAPGERHTRSLITST